MHINLNKMTRVHPSATLDYFEGRRRNRERDEWEEIKYWFSVNKSQKAFAALSYLHKNQSRGVVGQRASKTEKTKNRNLSHNSGPLRRNCFNAWAISQRLTFAESAWTIIRARNSERLCGTNPKPKVIHTRISQHKNFFYQTWKSAAQAFCESFLCSQGWGESFLGLTQ